MDSIQHTGESYEIDISTTNSKCILTWASFQTWIQAENHIVLAFLLAPIKVRLLILPEERSVNTEIPCALSANFFVCVHQGELVRTIFRTFQMNLNIFISELKLHILFC